MMYMYVCMHKYISIYLCIYVSMYIFVFFCLCVLGCCRRPDVLQFNLTFVMVKLIDKLNCTKCQRKWIISRGSRSHSQH